MKDSILKQIYYLKEHNQENETLEKMCDFVKFMGENFILKEDAYQLLMHFNEAQKHPLDMLNVERNYTSSIIHSRSSLFSKQISYDKEYLQFLIRLIDVHCYEKQYRHLSQEKYLNERVEDLKCAFFLVSLDYKKDFKPYHYHEHIDLSYYQMLERTLSILLYKTYFPEFWKEEYPKLEKYNPVLAKILRSNKGYLDVYNERRKAYYFANYEYQDVAFELEKKILLMVWTTMLDEYPRFQSKEYILSLVMMRLLPNLSMLYEMIMNEQYEDMEKYVGSTIDYCSEHSLRLYLH